jgi:prolipoprotein diacylglyceryltransferase
MAGDRDNRWQKAFQDAPLAMILLFLGIILGAGTGIWLLVAVVGFDDVPGEIAAPVIAGMAIAGGMVGVLVAVFIRWLITTIRLLSRRKRDD